MLVEIGVAPAADQDFSSVLRARRCDPGDQRTSLIRDQALVTAAPPSTLTAGQNTQAVCPRCIQTSVPLWDHRRLV